MQAKRPKATEERTTCDQTSCACGTGLCPGVAIAIGWGAGFAVTEWSGLTWLGWAVGVPLALILLSGIWRRLWKRP